MKITVPLDTRAYRLSGVYKDWFDQYVKAASWHSAETMTIAAARMDAVSEFIDTATPSELYPFGRFIQDILKRWRTGQGLFNAEAVYPGDLFVPLGTPPSVACHYAKLSLTYVEEPRDVLQEIVDYTASHVRSKSESTFIYTQDISEDSSRLSVLLYIGDSPLGEGWTKMSTVRGEGQ